MNNTDILVFLLACSTQAQVSGKYYDTLELVTELELKKDFSYTAYDGGAVHVGYYGNYIVKSDTIQFTCAHLKEENPNYKPNSKTES